MRGSATSLLGWESAQLVATWPEFRVRPGQPASCVGQGRLDLIPMGSHAPITVGHFGVILGSFGALLGPSWAHFGSFWDFSGTILGPFGIILGPSWGSFRRISGPSFFPAASASLRVD